MEIVKKKLEEALNVVSSWSINRHSYDNNFRCILGYLNHADPLIVWISKDTNSRLHFFKRHNYKIKSKYSQSNHNKLHVFITIHNVFNIRIKHLV